MEDNFAQSLTLVYCYAHEDQQWRDEIDLRLRDVKRRCRLINVLDGILLWDQEQKERLFAQLKENDLVLLLISSHFRDASSVAQLDLRTRLESLRWAGGCFVVALFLETIEWDGSPFGTRMFLPLLGRSFLAWQNQEQVFQDLEKGIQKAVEELWLTRGSWLQNEMHNYEKALDAYEEVLRLEASRAEAWYSKGNALLELRRYEDALHAYDKALQLDANFSWTWYAKGEALGRFQTL